MRKQATKWSGLTLKEHAETNPVPVRSLQKHSPHRHALTISMSLHCLNSLSPCDWHFCHSGTKIPNAGSAYCWTLLQASQPCCTACCVLACLQLRAAVSRVVLLCDAQTSLAASKQGGGCAALLKESGNRCGGAHTVQVGRFQRSGDCYQQFKVEAPLKHSPSTGLSQSYRRTHTTEEIIKVAWALY